MPTNDSILDILTFKQTLHRYPRIPNEPHRAWDAADELAIWFLLGRGEAVPKEKHRWPALEWPSPAARTLIIDDGFGALPLAQLGTSADADIWVMHDSWCARESLLRNAASNGLNIDERRLLHTGEPLPGAFDLVLIKAPPREDVMKLYDAMIAPHLSPGATVLTAAMLKHNRHSALGPTTHSSMYKKACLHATVVDADIEPPALPPPRSTTVGDIECVVPAGVFAGPEQVIDIGTQLLLEHLPAPSPDETHIGDLGCGSGLLGISAAHRLREAGHPVDGLLFFDDSARAIECARANATPPFGDDAYFYWIDCMTGMEEELDLILCNPPFHAGNVRGDSVAWRMMTHCHRVLRKGGRIRMVSNRHLHYHAKLSKIFGNHKVVTSNDQFVVMDAYK